MKNLKLWTNDIDYRDFEQDYRECNGLSVEEEIDEQDFINSVDTWNQDELDNLRMEVSLLGNYEHEIIIYGSLGRWDGRYDVHKFLGKNPKNCLYSDSDYVTWHIENEELKIDESHHDGNNYFTYRVLTVDPDYFENKVEEKGFDHCVRYYTKKIGKDIVEILGLNI